MGLTDLLAAGPEFAKRHEKGSAEFNFKQALMASARQAWCS